VHCFFTGFSPVMERPDVHAPRTRSSALRSPIGLHPSGVEVRTFLPGLRDQVFHRGFLMRRPLMRAALILAAASLPRVESEVPTF